MAYATRTLKLNNFIGLHMRPAAGIVKIADRFDACITVTKGQNHAAATSIFELIMLGIQSSDSFDLIAEGPDAPMALEALEQYLDTYSDLELQDAMEPEERGDFNAA